MKKFSINFHTRTTNIHILHIYNNAKLIYDCKKNKKIKKGNIVRDKECMGYMF